MGGGDNSEFLKTRLGYPETTGSEELRKEISSLYQNISGDDIVVLGAPVEGIFLTMQSLLRPKDHVVVLAPAYDALIHVPERVSQNVSLWPLREKEGAWELDFESLKRLVNQDTRAILINFPHNPTGFNPTNEDIREIVEIARSNDCWIFSDEMYKGLEFRNNEELVSVSDIYDRSVSLRGLSKTVGLPGLRFGWLVIKDRQLREKVVNWKYYTTLCATMASEYLGRMGIRAFAKLAEKNKGIIRDNFTLTETAFGESHPLFKWYPPLAGSVSVVKIEHCSAEDFCIRLAEDHGVVLLPAKYMGLEDRFFRLGLGRKNFDVGLRMLMDVVD